MEGKGERETEGEGEREKPEWTCKGWEGTPFTKTL